MVKFAIVAFREGEPDRRCVLEEGSECVVGRAPEGKITVICTQTLEAYTEFTGRLWWHYSSIEKDRIIYQPITVLFGRGLVDVALPREYFEWAILNLTGGKAPGGIREGVAAVLGKEETFLPSSSP